MSGLPPAYGIATAAVPGLVAALVGRSAQVVTGPTNTTGLLILSALFPLLGANGLIGPDGLPALATLTVLLANLTPRLGAALLAGQVRDWLIVVCCLAALPLGLWLLRAPLPAGLPVSAVGRWAYFFYPLHMLAIAAAAALLRMP